MGKAISSKRAGIDCEFPVRSEQTTELLGFGREHCSDRHGVDVPEADLREQWGRRLNEPR